MAQAMEYKCPCCGGAIAFDSSRQKMKCPYCDSEFEIDSLKDYEQELLDYQIIEQDEIAVVVHEDNPMQDITLDALKQIYTGEICTWNQLNP